MGKLGFVDLFWGIFRLRARYFPEKESTQSSPGLCPGPLFVKRCCQNTLFYVAETPHGPVVLLDSGVTPCLVEILDLFVMLRIRPELQ